MLPRGRDRSRSRSPGAAAALAAKRLAAAQREEFERTFNSLVSDVNDTRGRIEAKLFPGCHVCIQGLKAAADLNGAHGVLEIFIGDSGRWRVKLENGQSKDLKQENLQADLGPSSLQPGRTVILHGLKGAPELNGKVGSLEHYISATGRWRVKLGDDGQSKDLKPDNVKVEVSTQAEPSGNQAACDPVAHGEAAVDEEASTQAQPHDQPDSGGLEVLPGERCGPGNRFEVVSRLGEGVFSTVFRCRDTDTAAEGLEYAVKFTKASETTRLALSREVKLMEKLTVHGGLCDREGAQRVVNLIFWEPFVYKGRLALVFEVMKYSLLDALTRHGRGGGLPLVQGVRKLGKDILLALRVLRGAGVIHTDVKPENILLSHDGLSAKLSDFGVGRTVQEAKSHSRTDQLQPRYYRSPEIILGRDYDTQIDMWSAGATIYQLATGRILFCGDTNNGMVHEMMKVCGPFSDEMLLLGQFASKHFLPTRDFMLVTGDPKLDPLAKGAAKRSKVLRQSFDPPQRPVQALLAEEACLQQPEAGISPARHNNLVRLLADLLGGILVLDPGWRPTPDVALAHGFFQKGAGEAAETVSAASTVTVGDWQQTKGAPRPPQTVNGSPVASVGGWQQGHGIPRPPQTDAAAPAPNFGGWQQGHGVPRPPQTDHSAPASSFGGWQQGHGAPRPPQSGNAASVPSYGGWQQGYWAPRAPQPAGRAFL